MKISDPNDKSRQYPLKDIIKDVWQNAGDKRKYLVWGSILRAISDVAGLYFAFAIGTIVSYLTHPTRTLSPFFLVFSFWVLAVLIRYIGIYYAKRLMFFSSHTIWLNIEKKMMEVLIAKDSSWHEKESSGAKVKRIERGSLGYRDILNAYVSNYIEIIIRFIGIPIVLLKFDRTVAILVIAYLIIYFLASKYLRKKFLLAAHKFNIYEDQLGGSIYEIAGNIRTIRVLHIGKEMINRISQNINNMLEAVYNRIKAAQFRGSIMAGFSQVFMVSVTAYIAYNIFHEKYTVGFIVLFTSYFTTIWETIRELTDVSQDVIVARQSIARMYDLIGKDIPKEKGSLGFPKQWDKLKVENLSFSYGDNEVLKDISFVVDRGQKVGIVGLSGAGKSTLFKLLIRERDDFTGKILIDGTSTGDIKTDEFYKKVSIVPQDTEVFNFSLSENITMAQPEKSEDIALLEKSLTISHVQDFLYKLPYGAETLIGEKGVKLSGGERQRLGIARAIFKEPEILLLDEATSHLDIESEEKIKDSLHTFFGSITAIVIAHRLTTIKEMDKIIVFEDGRIIEQGTLKELLKAKGRFSELWNKQEL